MTKSDEKTITFYRQSVIKDDESIQDQQKQLIACAKEVGIEEYETYADNGDSGESAN